MQFNIYVFDCGEVILDISSDRILVIGGKKNGKKIKKFANY